MMRVGALLAENLLLRLQVKAIPAGVTNDSELSLNPVRSKNLAAYKIVEKV